MKELTVAGLGSLLIAGCAPDAWNNVQATGFNGFLNQIATECAPLRVAEMVITPNYQAPNYAADDYDQWLDQTSRLYYKKISPQTYSQNVNNFWPGDATARSTQCVLSKVPPA